MPTGTPNVDLTFDGASGTINGGVYMVGTYHAAPTTFSSFLQIRHNGTEQGYNTNSTLQYDTLDDQNATHSILLANVPIVVGDGSQGTQAGVAYREFRLNVAEAGNTKQYLSLDSLQIWQEESGSLTSFTPNSGFTGTHTNYLAYNLDAGGDHWVGLKEPSNGNGAVQTEFTVLVPDSYFINDPSHRYVTLYSKFGVQTSWEADSGAEEWGLSVNSVGPTPALTIHKTATVPGGTADVAGEVISYGITVANVGDVNLTSVTVTDPSASNLAPVLSAGFNVGDTNHDNQLSTGETWQYTASHTVTQADIDSHPPTTGGPGTIHNAASVTTNEGASGSASVDIPVDYHPVVDVTKSATVPGGTADTAGEVISYTIDVANLGNVTLTGVSVSDPSVTNLTLASGDNGNGLLDVGETWHYTASHTVTQTDLDTNGGGDGTIDNTASVTTTQGASDSASASVIVVRNHPVMFTSGPESASLSETADTTGSSVIDSTTPVPTGSLAFADPDTGDTHTVQVSVDSTVWSGGAAAPAATQSDLASALATTLNDSTGSGSGSVDWTFGIPDRDLDFLAAGETLTVTYDVKVADASTNDTQTVTVTATGANDAVVMNSGPESASLTERPDTNGSTELDTTTGTLSFTDVDLSDVHSTSVALSSAMLDGNEISPSFDMTTALQTALNDSAGTGAGDVDWTFSIQDRSLDFLPEGSTLTLTYDVTVSDAATSATQSVTITVTGTADPLSVHPLSATASDTLFTDEGNIVLGGNVISDSGSNGGDAGTTLDITAVDGSAGNVGHSIAGTYGSVRIFADGSYQYVANAALDALQAGDHPTDQFTFTVTDSLGRSDTATLTVNVVGADDAPYIVAADATASITEDAGPSTLVNGGFETGDLSGWTTTSSIISAEFLGFGGEFGNYAANLAPTSTPETLSQDVATTAGQHYSLGFYVLGDSESSSNSMTVTWDGATVLALGTQFGGLTHYTFDVVATDASSTLAFTYTDNGIGMFVDQVEVNPETGPATESASGTIAFTDVETSDTHTASFIPQGGDYVGTFSFDPVSESGGSGSVGWHFTVDNADIQFLGQNQTVFQTYTVLITDGGGVNTSQDVTVALHGTNDAPTTGGNDNVITDADVNGGFFLPGWVLTFNDSDPDATDTLSVNSITGSSGLNAFLFGGVITFDDATLGGSFTYNTTDGIAVSPGSGTVTVTNSAPVATLAGTDGNDIIVAVNDNEALNGGGGNDILIGNSGTHILTGGSGDDIFAFQLVPDQGSTPANAITDFDNVFDHDMVAISANAFGAGLIPGQDTSGIFESTGDADFLGSLFHYDTANQTLYFSSDGTDANAIVVVQFQTGVLLNAHDLMIV